MKKLVLLLIILNILFFVNFASASYQIDVSIPDQVVKGTEVTLSEYINYLYLFGLGAVGVAALGMLVYSGFLYMLSDTVTSKDKAKDHITGALSGLVLGLAAYLILNTINPVLLQNQPPELPSMPSVTALPSLEGHQIDCTNPGDLCAVVDIFPVSFVKKGVILDGVRQPIIDEVNRFASEVGLATIVVTSGTDGTMHEEGSCSHYNGCKLDIRLNPSIVRYIENNFTPKDQRSDGTPLYQSPRGACYAIEGNHIDIASDGC